MAAIIEVGNSNFLFSFPFYPVEKVTIIIFRGSKVYRFFVCEASFKIYFQLLVFTVKYALIAWTFNGSVLLNSE